MRKSKTLKTFFRPYKTYTRRFLLCLQYKKKKIKHILERKKIFSIMEQIFK